MGEQLGFDAFAPEPVACEQQPWRIRAMWDVHGRTYGERCKTCKHLLCKQMSGRYYKCELSAVSAGPGTD